MMVLLLHSLLPRVNQTTHKAGTNVQANKFENELGCVSSKQPSRKDIVGVERKEVVESGFA